MLATFFHPAQDSGRKSRHSLVIRRQSLPVITVGTAQVPGTAPSAEARDVKKNEKKKTGGDSNHPIMFTRFS